MELTSARCYRRCGGIDSFAELKITLLALYGGGEANPHAQDDRAYLQDGVGNGDLQGEDDTTGEGGRAREDGVLFKSAENSDNATVKDAINQIERKISRRRKTACSR